MPEHKLVLFRRPNVRLFVQSLIILIFCMLLWPARLVHANTFTVASAADSGAVTLRQAIVDANATHRNGSEWNIIRGNYIGTDATGTQSRTIIGAGFRSMLALCISCYVAMHNASLGQLKLAFGRE